MSTSDRPQNIADLARERGLFLKDLGPGITLRLYNQGWALPGPLGLRRMAERLDMAPQDVMEVCRRLVAWRKDQVAS
jgi:hypothetical protein